MKLLLLFNYLSNGGNYFILASIKKTHYYEHIKSAKLSLIDLLFRPKDGIIV